MKKSFNSILTLKKETIAGLSNESLGEARGGGVSEGMDCTQDEYCTISCTCGCNQQLEQV